MSIHVNSSLKLIVINRIRERYNRLQTVIKTSEVRLHEIDFIDTYCVCQLDQDNNVLYLTNHYNPISVVDSIDVKITAMFGLYDVDNSVINRWLNSEEGLIYHLRREILSDLSDRVEWITKLFIEPDQNIYSIDLIEEIFTIADEAGVLVPGFKDFFKGKYLTLKDEVESYNHSQRIAEQYFSMLESDRTKPLTYDERIYFYIHESGEVRFNRKYDTRSFDCVLPLFKNNEELYSKLYKYFLKNQRTIELKKDIVNDLAELIHQEGVPLLVSEIEGIINMLSYF